MRIFIDQEKAQNMKKIINEKILLFSLKLIIEINSEIRNKIKINYHI